MQPHFNKRRFGPKKDHGGYRSGFERKIAESLSASEVPFKYEQTTLEYVKPSTVCKYTPDFELPNGILIETKGRLTASDRKKMVLVKAMNKERDIRILFQRAKNPIYKGSKTTYGAWADANGFVWAEGVRVPTAWITEGGVK